MFWWFPSCRQSETGSRAVEPCASGCWSSGCCSAESRWWQSRCCVCLLEYSGMSAGFGQSALWLSKIKKIYNAYTVCYRGGVAVYLMVFVWRIVSLKKIIDHHNLSRRSDRSRSYWKCRSQGGVTATGFQPVGTLGPGGGIHLLFPCAWGDVSSSCGSGG